MDFCCRVGCLKVEDMSGRDSASVDAHGSYSVVVATDCQNMMKWTMLMDAKAVFTEVQQSRNSTVGSACCTISMMM